MNPTIRFAEGIAGRLGNVKGVIVVALGGSWARGEAHPDSDVDLGVYYRPDRPPAVGELRRLAQELDDRNLPELVTETGGWGPWINGGGWLRVAGRPVDWLYRDASKVAATIERGISGQTACHYQPGHPHGFHEHIYLGEVFHCHALYDPEGLLRDLKSVVSTYPPKLKRTLVEKYLWEAGFSLEIARKPAARGEASYASGCLFRGVACMVQALFAANERWFLNEKGSVSAVNSFAAKPEAFRRGLGGCSGARDRTPEPSPEASLATRSSSPKYASRALARCSIASFRDSNDFNYEIYRINAHGGAQTNLTHNPGFCLAPAYCRTTPGSPSKAPGTAPRYLQDECRRASQTRRTFNTMYDADPSWQPLLW